MSFTHHCRYSSLPDCLLIDGTSQLDYDHRLQFNFKEFQSIISRQLLHYGKVTTEVLGSALSCACLDQLSSCVISAFERCSDGCVNINGNQMLCMKVFVATMSL